MKKEFYIIPKKIAVYAITNVKEPFTNGKVAVTLGRDSLKSSRTKAVKDLSCSLSIGTDRISKDLIVYEIGNTGLKFLIPEHEDINELIRRSYNSQIYLELVSPELPQGSQYYVVVPVEILLSVLGQGGNVINRRLPGSYCVEPKKESFTLYLEDPTDRGQAKAKKTGELLMGPGTSDWEPGCLYAKKDGKFSLYLGKLGPNFLEQEYNRSLNLSINNFMGGSEKHCKSEGNDLIVQVEGNLEKWRGKDLKTVLIEILKGSSVPTSLSTNTSKGLGVKLEEVLWKDEDFDVQDFVRTFCLDTIGKTSYRDMTGLQKHLLLFLPEKLIGLKNEILEADRAMCKGYAVTYLKDLIVTRGKTNAISEFKDILNRSSIHFNHRYRWYDFRIGDSQLFTKEELKKSNEIFFNEVLTLSGCTIQ